MSDITTGYNPTAEQQQNMDNLSFDRKYLVNAVEILTENEAGNAVVRQKPLATSDNQTNGTQASKFVDELGVPYGVKHIQNKPRVSSMPYTYDIAEGNVANHIPWSKIGYSPAQTANVNTDIWSYSGTQPAYVFPTAPMGMEVLSSNSADTGTVIHTGTSTGGSLTSLISTGENFLTTTAIGDAIVLDASGTSPEYGYISAIVSDTELTVTNGFSHGGSGSGRAYSIVDTSATAGGQAVEINYLDGDYLEKREIVILNGTNILSTVNTNLFRINSFRIILAGANKIPTGNITLRNLADTPVYSYITAGFNRARNIVYTVPAGKALYITNFDAGYATTGNANKEYARITTRANIDPTTKFMTDGLFYPFTDAVMQQTTVYTKLDMPTKLPAKTDIKVSGIVSITGVMVCTLRGWLENE